MKVYYYYQLNARCPHCREFNSTAYAGPYVRICWSCRKLFHVKYDEVKPETGRDGDCRYQGREAEKSNATNA